MLEYFVSLIFLCIIWLIGQTVVFLCTKEHQNWLSLPIGLSLIGLITHALYFGAGLPMERVRWCIVIIGLASLIFLMIKREIRNQSLPLLLCAAFMTFLLIPAWMGGEQYFAFRGNHFDHFNYIDQALALNAHAISTYRSQELTMFLDHSAILHGIPMLDLRPTVGLVFSTMLPSGQGDLHLLAFSYASVLWSAIFSACVYGWHQLIMKGNGSHNNKGVYLLAVPLAYCVGFWGQWIFDINSWSQMASMSIEIAWVFLFLDLLPEIRKEKKPLARPTYKNVLCVILFAGGLAFYPESWVVHTAIMFLVFLSFAWKIRHDLDTSFIKRNASWLLLGVLLAILPNLSKSVEFIISQVRFGSSTLSIVWAGYFDSYWMGQCELPDAERESLKKIFQAIKNHERTWHDLWSAYQNGSIQIRNALFIPINFIAGIFGLYFLTPACGISQNLWVFCALAVITLDALLLNRAYQLMRPNSLDHNSSLISLLKRFMAWSLPIFVYLISKGSLWSIGKLLSYISPYMSFLICTQDSRSSKSGGTQSLSKKFTTWREMILPIVFVGSQICFGIARIISVDETGIGYNNKVYPSIQDMKLKTDIRWEIHLNKYLGCNGIKLEGFDQSGFALEYVTQKLDYMGIAYFSETSVLNHFVDGIVVSYQKPIKFSCTITLRKDYSGRLAFF